MLCREQIYRHVFFNENQEGRRIWQSFVLTVSHLVVLYWYQNRMLHENEALWENLPLDPNGLETD